VVRVVSCGIAPPLNVPFAVNCCVLPLLTVGAAGFFRWRHPPPRFDCLWDISTGTEIMTGSFKVYRVNGGIILIDAGRQVVTEDGTLISESGQHPFNAYFIFGDTSALQPLCDALE